MYNLSYMGCKRVMSCWLVSARLTKHVKQISRVSMFQTYLFSCYLCLPNYNSNIKRAVSTHLFRVVFESCHHVIFEIVGPRNGYDNGHMSIHD